MSYESGTITIKRIKNPLFYYCLRYKIYSKYFSGYLFDDVEKTNRLASAQTFR